MSQTQYRKPEPYRAPEWASGLVVVPKTRIPLTMVPTPIHPWDVPGVPSPFSVKVKRDDLTHCTMTGNKCRKAEFLLADALDKECDCIITFGGGHSNHARVMSLAARELGLDCVLFIQTHPHSDQPSPVEQVGCQGNMMLCRLTGATILTCPKEEGLTHYDDVARISKFMEAHAEKMRAEGRRPYVIPVGGTCPLGEWGYLNAWEELRGQGALDDIDDIIVTFGSGGTTGGLAIGNYLTGSKVKVHCVSISDSADYVYGVIGRQLSQFGLEGVEPKDIVDVTDEYTLGGHGCVNKELKELVISVTSATGVPVDTTYTGKTVWGMVSEMATRPGRFRGNRVLFIHTGGIFNTFNGVVDDVVKTTPSSCRIHAYQEV